MSTRVSCECVAGLGCWSQLRSLASEARFRGYDVELFEGPGWIQRRFVFRGDPVAIEAIEVILRKLDRQSRAA